MHQYILQLLKALEVAIPPAEGNHHALTYVKIGSEEAGFEDKLVLWINDNGTQAAFFLDTNDIAIAAFKTAGDVVALHKKNCEEAASAYEASKVAAKVTVVEPVIGGKYKKKKKTA